MIFYIIFIYSLCDPLVFFFFLLYLKKKPLKNDVLHNFYLLTKETV